MFKFLFLITINLIWLDLISGQCREVTIDECSYTNGPFESIKGTYNSLKLGTIHSCMNDQS